MSRKMKFGVTLPQYGASWTEVRDLTACAEESGFDSVWVSDHFFGIGSEDPLEAWTEMSAVAAVTSRVELGFLVLCNNYRPPPLLAKMATTLDEISNGRLIVGAGAGWFSQEYEAYGYEYPGIRTRLEQLEEGLEILKRMWTEEAATFHGLHYHIEGARCRPAPTRKPHPPILIGGGGEQILLKLVARYADVWNNLGMAHAEFSRKLEALHAHCERLGRDPSTIETSQQVVAAIGASKAEAERRTEAVMQEIGFHAGAPDLAPTGTPDEIIARLRKNREMGVQGIVASFGRHATPEQVQLFGREVISAFR